MAAVKHPCVGDPLYGSDPTLAARLGLERQWLHAVELGFEHPGSGEWVTFSSSYPADLKHALGRGVAGLTPGHCVTSLSRNGQDDQIGPR
jgi:23S rRNA pseudouridine1911/1915/1917 synthase